MTARGYREARRRRDPAAARGASGKPGFSCRRTDPLPGAAGTRPWADRRPARPAPAGTGRNAPWKPAERKLRMACCRPALQPAAAVDATNRWRCPHPRGDGLRPARPAVTTHDAWSFPTNARSSPTCPHLARHGDCGRRGDAGACARAGHSRPKDRKRPKATGPRRTRARVRQRRGRPRFPAARGTGRPPNDDCGRRADAGANVAVAHRRRPARHPRKVRQAQSPWARRA